MEKEKKKKSTAQIKATEKWEKENYDKILLRLPKGTKERIQSVSDSVNGYITQSVLSSLQIDEKIKEMESRTQSGNDTDIFLPFS